MGEPRERGKGSLRLIGGGRGDDAEALSGSIGGDGSDGGEGRDRGHVRNGSKGREGRNGDERRDGRDGGEGRDSDGGEGRDGGASTHAGAPRDGFKIAVLHELYRRYGGSVYGRCRYLLRDPMKAEDAMQDVFAKALTGMPGFRSDASPLTWLMTIATHHCLNLLRAERAPWRRRFERDETARIERVESAAHARHVLGAGGLEDRDAVRRLLGRVDLETQVAAVHYYVDEMTLEEVARAVGRSVPTVRKRLEAFAALAKQELGA